jgi:hypothetical protein
MDPGTRILELEMLVAEMVEALRVAERDLISCFAIPTLRGLSQRSLDVVRAAIAKGMMIGKPREIGP